MTLLRRKFKNKIKTSWLEACSFNKLDGSLFMLIPPPQKKSATNSVFRNRDSQIVTKTLTDL